MRILRSFREAVRAIDSSLFLEEGRGKREGEILLWQKGFRGPKFLWGIPGNRQDEGTLRSIRLADMTKEDQWNASFARYERECGEAQRDRNRRLKDELRADFESAASMDLPHIYKTETDLRSRHGGVRKDLARDSAKRHDTDLSA